MAKITYTGDFHAQLFPNYETVVADTGRSNEVVRDRLFNKGIPEKVEGAKNIAVFLRISPSHAQIEFGSKKEEAEARAHLKEHP